MKRLKSYSGIWNVEKVIYAVSDFRLPFPVTFSQMVWFVISLMAVILFGDYPPFSFIGSGLIKYVVIPVAFTWFMSRKSFDGKKPLSFLKSCVSFFIRPKMVYAGKAVKAMKNHRTDDGITVVDSRFICPGELESDWGGVKHGISD